MEAYFSVFPSGNIILSIPKIKKIFKSKDYGYILNILWTAELTETISHYVWDEKMFELNEEIRDRE